METTSAISTVSDDELMQGILAAEQTAFNELYSRHCLLLRKIIGQVLWADADVEETVQDVFVEIWNRAANFDPGKGKALGWINAISSPSTCFSCSWILIALVQYGDLKHPMYVVLIMFGVQTLESTIISPKVVGESTGLHPLTVIISVFFWSAILDGPVDAILAVPLTCDNDPLQVPRRSIEQGGCFR